MKKFKEAYRMPDGNATTNAKKMCKAWKDIYQPICDEFDLGVIGYDPGILFKNNTNNGTFDLDVSIAIKIRDLINQRNILAKRIK